MATNASKHSKFYLTMSCLCAGIVLLGFSRRWLLPLATGTFAAPAIVYLHGFITFGWVLFLIVQSLLVARGRTALHRSMGLAGIALGTLLFSTATEVAILLLARELKAGGPSTTDFAATLFSIIVLGAGLFTLALVNVNRPEVHKRLMMLAAFVIVTPALARIIQLIDGSVSRLTRNDLACFASDALVLIAIAYDTRTRGKPHTAYVVGGVCILVVQAATLLFRPSPAWHGVTTWLSGLVG